MRAALRLKLKCDGSLGLFHKSIDDRIIRACNSHPTRTSLGFRPTLDNCSEVESCATFTGCGVSFSVVRVVDSDALSLPLRVGGSQVLGGHAHTRVYAFPLVGEAPPLFLVLGAIFCLVMDQMLPQLEQQGSGTIGVRGDDGGGARTQSRNQMCADTRA